MRSLCNRGGFTLLELLAVLAIMATLSLFGLPAIQEWNAKRSFAKSMNDVYSELSRGKLEAFSRNTTTKVTTGKSGDTYTLTLYYNATPVTSCSAASGWTQIETMTVDLNYNFSISGSGITGDVCFFRDGTSTGGVYDFAQKNAQTNLGNGSINIILATGFIDVTKN